MATKTVLLVEDSAADAYLIQRAAEECDPNIQLRTLPDGVEVLHFLCKEPPFTAVPTPALIILDLGLPTMDGTQLLAQIRELPAYQRTPLVVLSATPKEREEQHCLRLGASAYIQKMQNFPVYFATIKTLIWHWLVHHARLSQDTTTSPCVICKNIIP
jgi:CheY-like chemotaxis protein